jgi:hypothetical protein
VYAYELQTGNGCAQTDGPTWASRVANMEPEVQSALNSIEAVTSAVHYPYHLILVSYGGPAPEPPARYSDAYWSKLWHGCPIYDADARWGHDTAAPVLDVGERTVAANANLRFLDMVDGFNGHEVCTNGIIPSQEWVRGVTYDPNSSDWWTEHSVQQSLHPNALGHSKIAGCVTEFVAQTYREGGFGVLDGAARGRSRVGTSGIRCVGKNTRRLTLAAALVDAFRRRAVCLQITRTATSSRTTRVKCPVVAGSLLRRFLRWR